jgi:hypothetical protein
VTRTYPPLANLIDVYLQGNRDYIAVQKALRTHDNLHGLSAEIYPEAPGNRDALAHGGARPPEISNAERHMVAQMLTVLENALLGLRLDLYWRHPVHVGWMEVFRRWFAAPTFRANWAILRGEFSREFQQFIDDVVDPMIENGAGAVPVAAPPGPEAPPGNHH